MHTIEIVHRTRYEYAEPVTLGEYRLMFRPRDSHDLRLLHTELAIVPAGNIRWVHDAFGNSIAIASFAEPAQVLEFVSTIRLEHFETSSVVPPIEPLLLAIGRFIGSRARSRLRRPRCRWTRRAIAN